MIGPRTLRILILLLTLNILAAAPRSEDESLFLQEIQRLEREYGGHLGFMARNLNTGEAIGYNASERFPTASAIKFPIMAAFFHLVDLQRLDPNVRVVLTNEDKKPGSGILQFMSDGSTISLLDAVELMIILSDNTATNLVLDRLAPTHSERMSVVNDFLASKGLKNTRLLNRLYTVATKARTPEALRYGIGVSTPEDMVELLGSLYAKTLAEPASCKAMMEIMKRQMYREMIPRLLPAADCEFLQIENKTGSVDESKIDAALILSDRVKLAVAIFVDKHPDHGEDLENRATLLGARVARAAWNHFTGSTGYEVRRVLPHQVDWNTFPGGRWAIYRSPAAPFPHKDRMNGFRIADGTEYPFQPHYSDDSVVVVVPGGFRETEEGTNLILHFHGHMNDNLGALEQYGMPQALIAAKINALLVLPQGPYRARDSFGGKMEDEGGLKRLAEDVLETMKNEQVLKEARLNKVIVSAHSGGYRPAAYALERGGLDGHITDVFLFDAFYAQQDFFFNWLNRGPGTLYAAYTEHLAKEHTAFEQRVGQTLRKRISFTPTSVGHDKVIQEFFESWLARVGPSWRLKDDAESPQRQRSQRNN
jgi:beta-lactamase class A